MERANHIAKSSTAADTSAEPVLTWKVHILRENPGKLLLIIPVVITSLLVSILIFGNPLSTAVILFLFTSALAEYLFPIRYEITERGASVRTLVGRTLVEWSRVKKYYLDERGIKLSTLRRPGRLEAYRGVYLRFGDNREEVIRVVRRMRDAGNATDGDPGSGSES